jgi:hypothetical protein
VGSGAGAAGSATGAESASAKPSAADTFAAAKEAKIEAEKFVATGGAGQLYCFASN